MEVGRVGNPGYIPATPKKKQTQQPSAQSPGRSLVDTFVKNQSMGRKGTQDSYGADWIGEQVKNADDQAKATAKELKARLNCQKIAMRIMAGDQVDPKDVQYLMEHDPKAFQMAMSMRRPKEDPEKCKRITEDEESRTGETGGASAESGGGVEDVAAAPTQDGSAVTP